MMGRCEGVYPLATGTDWETWKETSVTEVRSTCFSSLAVGERPGSVDVAWWAQLALWLSVHSYETRFANYKMTGWR
jgi:hypothetical protein